MNEVIPGILHWQARHPNIKTDVSSYLLTDSGTALDPILPQGESPGWLGHRVQRVVLSIRHHLRSAADFGVPVLAHRAGLEELRDNGVEVRSYEVGEEIAPGVRVLPFGRISADDSVLRIDSGPGALAFGDGLIHPGELGHPPDHLLGEDPEAVKKSIVEGLVPLLEEDFDALLFAHGTPIAAGGRELLRRFVQSRRG